MKTHLDLLREGYVIFLVGPQRYMTRLGSYYALHIQSLLDAILSGQAGATDFLLDEFTNVNLKELVERLTTMRGFGGRCHLAGQSISQVKEKYGENGCQTILENAVVKQFFGFSNFEQAEAMSRALGDGQNVSRSLNFSSERQELSGSYQNGKERLFTPDELMRLPSDEQMIHVKDVGFIHAKKVRQNEIAPYCFDIRDNPLEGSRLTPNPKIELPTGYDGDVS